MAFKKIFIFFILLLSIYSFDVDEKLKDICPKGCKRYFYCDEKEKKCKFKGFFPIYPLELLYIFVLMMSSSLATSCGIGGGTVYSSMILGVEELEPKEAFPISNFLILLCGFITFLSFVFDKYEHPQNKFIQYDVAVIFGPSMLIGAKFGAILNRTLSSTALLIFLICLLIFTLKKTYKNIQKAKAKEELLEKQKDKTLQNDNDLNVKEKFLKNQISTPIDLEDTKDQKNPLLFSIVKNNPNENNYDFDTNNQDRVEFDSIMTGFDDQMDFNKSLAKKRVLTEEDQEILKEDEKPLNWPRINFILLMEAVVMIDQLVEGTNKVPSFLGIKKCSFSYWLCFFIYILFSLYLVSIAVKKVKIHISKKQELIPNFKSEVSDNLQQGIFTIVILGIFAGIVSSSLGIGGGMITNPVFSGLGMDPKESSSTSNFLIIVTALATSFIFILSGQLNIGYSLILGFLCTIAALIGSCFIIKYINRTGKSSILLIIMEYFLIASFFIAVYKLITVDTQGVGFFLSIFKVNKYC